MLPDILRPNLDLIVCGTAAGNRSAERQHYYAGIGNRFYQILHDTGLTPRLLDPTEDHLLPEFGIGLTDLAKGVSGMDKDLPQGSLTAGNLLPMLLILRPKILAFNGKKAAEIFTGRSVTYGLLDHPGPTRFFVAPSTSGAARGYWDPEAWHKLAKLTKEMNVNALRAPD